MSGVYKISGLLGRILISFMFLQSGINKIGGYKATLGYMESKGVPGMLLPFVIFLEIVGAIAIIVGWQTRLFAFALAGFCILAALLFHMDFSNQIQPKLSQTTFFQCIFPVLQATRLFTKSIILFAHAVCLESVQQISES